MKRKKIVYIAGLGHSGSTILDMILGSNSKIIGLGEIMNFVKRKNKQIDLKSSCSCGKTGNNCDFWSQAEQIIDDTNNNVEAYLKLIDYFYNKYGEETILVDSSKNSYNYLKILNEKFDLKIIFLSKDFRSWSFSRHLSSKTPVFIKEIHWFAENIKLLYRFKKMKLNVFKLGYEELALYPEFSLKKTCDYLKIDFEKEMLIPTKTKSHIISGNIVRADKEKRKKIVYDARWITSARIIFSSIFFTPFFKFNKKLVYSNILEKSLNPSSLFFFHSKKRHKAEQEFN
ncbi:MAG: hypothetical protein U9Q83_08890 [Bacteroidota bacterium]|nr:hypothetical protein [Bacteroidota bacterium]